MSSLIVSRHAHTDADAMDASIAACAKITKFEADMIMLNDCFPGYSDIVAKRWLDEPRYRKCFIWLARANLCKCIDIKSATLLHDVQNVVDILKADIFEILREKVTDFYYLECSEWFQDDAVIQMKLKYVVDMGGAKLVNVRSDDFVDQLDSFIEL
jgi:hypothetical protein